MENQEPEPSPRLVEKEELVTDKGSPLKIQKGPSRRCRHWARGLCNLGAKCTFLHSGVAGVHVPCRHFVRTGSCSRGDLCDFKHELPNYGYAGRFTMGYPMNFGPGPVMRPFVFASPPPPHLLPQPSLPFWLSGDPLATMAMHIPPLAAVTPQSPRQDMMFAPLSPTTPTSSSRCRHWEHGSCRLAKACGFLHDPSTPQKFRTKECRHWEKGNCRMNENCCFAHTAHNGNEPIDRDCIILSQS